MTDPSICYVASRWGAPTQTFVRREALAVAALADVSALSLKRPLPTSTDATITCRHLGATSVAWHAFAIAVRHPRRVGSILTAIVRRARLRNIPSLIVAALIGIAWVGAGLVDGTRRLHAHFGWVAVTSAWAASRISGARYSVVLHAFEIHREDLVDGFTPVPLRSATRVFTISERDRRVVNQRWGIEANVLRMGVPQAWMDSSDDREDDLVVAVGSLVPKKGHDVLIEALSFTAMPWRALIVGEGPERSRLQRRIEDLGLADRVQLIGHLAEAEVRELLSTATVSCLASVPSPNGDRDGIPVALIEAMARGTPVVATRVGAISELVEGAGILVAPGDPMAVASALDAMCDASLRQQLSASGVHRVSDDGWTVESQVDAVIRAAPEPGFRS